MKLEITQEHINHGVPEDEWYCPISWALREKYPEYDFAVFGHVIEKHDTIYNEVGEYVKTEVEEYVTTDEVRQFVDMFDCDLPVEPCILDLGPIKFN